MSIARAFTTRRVKQSLQTADLEQASQRSNMKKGSVGSIRHKISSPVELIHTTNMLSYNAPDINLKTASSTGSSHRSDDDMSDSHTTGSTPPTSPDVESSPKRSPNPKRSLSPEPNHLSSYFTAPSQIVERPAAQPEAPVVPQRAPSHAKKPYNTLGRQRSASGMSEQSQRTVSTKASFTFSRSSSTSTSTTATSHSSVPPPHHRAKPSGPTAPPAPSFPAKSTPQSQQQPQQHRKDYSQSQHPFGPELAQVSEIAEEYGVKEQVNVVDAEEQSMLNKGLLKFSAEEYLGEIRGMFANFFLAQPGPNPNAGWI
ncbi:hypothetical protein MFIFM68171_01453 [Madurella fahalii]|uniref:Uncharacterized protein n=1 Tax=Madurella fahalii TaxID=1157608 RepID=A0ABQ0G0F6_9PEZI